MENQLAQSATDEDAAIQSPAPEAIAGQYEILLKMTRELLATSSLEERILLALDTITSDLGYSRAAIALIDEHRATLRMSKAVGFDDNSELEQIRMPLDLAAMGVSVVYGGGPAWIERGGDQYSPYLRRFAIDTDLLALPLFGTRWVSEGPEGDLARKYPRDDKYWQPEAICLGVLYIGTNRSETTGAALKVLTLCADQIGISLATALRVDQLAASVKELRRERLWVESIMESVADPIVLTNLDNQILLQNRRAEELFSGSEDASEGKRRALKMNDLLFSAYLSSAVVASTEAIGRDLTLVDPIEGSDIHFEVISTLALNEEGERVGLVSIFRDVTDLKQANEELARNYGRLQQAEAEARRERDRLELIIGNVANPIVVFDAGGNFIFFNRRAEMLFSQERLSRQRTELLLQHEDPSSAQALAAVRANSVKLTSFISGLASETHTGRQAEIELIDPETGETLPMEINSVEVLDAKGEVTAVVSILHDLSEIRELERRRVEQQLFESEKLAAVGTLAASIAHEVNNPLEAIKNALFLLQSSKDEAANARFFGIALKETERVSQIIRRMLGFARRSGGVEWVEVNQLIEETLVLVEKKLQHSGIRVVTILDPALPAIHAYPDQLRQVFLNLILNAQQAIDGPGRIKIKTSTCELAAQPSVLVEVSDTGAGISEDVLARIFEPFFSMRKDGSGLGLWVTQNIVRQHGGSIEVKSSKKEGTTFSLILLIDSPALLGAGQK
jgi:PAS domain S-box-containing protein